MAIKGLCLSDCKYSHLYVIPYSGVWAGLTDSLLKDKIEKGGEVSLPKADYKKILAFILATWDIFPLIVLSVFYFISFHILLFYFILFYFRPCLTACGILVSQPGNKSTPPAVEAQEVQSLRWTARKSHVWSLKSLAVDLPYTLSWASAVQQPTWRRTKICQTPYDWAWQWISIPIAVTPPDEACWRLGKTSQGTLGHRHLAKPSWIPDADTVRK